MNEFLIVDGYNIIGAWPELSKLKDIDLEEARDQIDSHAGGLSSLLGYESISCF